MAGTLSYEELEQRAKELEKKAVEHKKVKDALTLFSHSVESSIDGIAMGNTQNRITYVNEAFARMFGYSREELAGKEISFIYAEDQIPLSVSPLIWNCYKVGDLKMLFYSLQYSS